MRNLVWIILLMVTAAGAQTKMSAAEADRFKATVRAQAAETQTVTSDFVQYQHIEFITEDIESSGKMAFRSPNMVKWEYLQPDPYSILFKNEKLYTDQNGKKSAMDMGSNKIFKQLNQLITASIKGDMFDAKEFTISYLKTEDNSEVHFIPVDAQFAEFIKAIHLTFNAKGEVMQVKMMEASEDYTMIVFSNRKTNQTLSDEVFAH